LLRSNDRYSTDSRHRNCLVGRKTWIFYTVFLLSRPTTLYRETTKIRNRQKAKKNEGWSDACPTVLRLA
jgi:hypothetical protein